MGWLRKIFHVLLVVGVAALMSVPFKRVPPQQMTKSAGRGEWQLVKPRLQFKQLIKSAEPVTPREGESSGEPVGERAPASDSRSPEPARQASQGSGTPPIGRPIPVDDPPAIRDQEAYPTAPISRLPRIEAPPSRTDHFSDETSPPSLPSEFHPLGETPKPDSTTPHSAPGSSPAPTSAPSTNSSASSFFGPS